MGSGLETEIELATTTRCFILLLDIAGSYSASSLLHFINDLVGCIALDREPFTFSFRTDLWGLSNVLQCHYYVQVTNSLYVSGRLRTRSERIYNGEMSIIARALRVKAYLA